MNERQTCITVRMTHETRAHLEKLLPEFERRHGSATISSLVRFCIYRTIETIGQGEASVDFEMERQVPR